MTERCGKRVVYRSFDWHSNQIRVYLTDYRYIYVLFEYYSKFLNDIPRNHVENIVFFFFVQRRRNKQYDFEIVIDHSFTYNNNNNNTNIVSSAYNILW